MTHVTCRLTAENRDRLRNPTLGNRVWATFTFLLGLWLLPVVSRCGLPVRLLAFQSRYIHRSISSIGSSRGSASSDHHYHMSHAWLLAWIISRLVNNAALISREIKETDEKAAWPCAQAVLIRTAGLNAPDTHTLKLIHTDTPDTTPTGLFCRVWCGGVNVLL